jgi:multiple sugar transport system ATP-binding protein
MAVVLTEPLGNETLLFVDFAGREWVSRMLDPRPLAAGASLPVSFDLSHAHLFDAASGVALAREEYDGQDRTRRITNGRPAGEG